MVYRMVFNVDGGCRNNGRPNATGAAACCLQRHYGSRYTCKTRHLPRDPTPTSQRAEIVAIIMALEWALERYDELRGYPDLEVTIHSDSKYAVGCMTQWIYQWTRNGWLNAKGDDVCNRDLIERASNLDDRVRALGSVGYVWIPREDNTAADELCDRALDEQEQNGGEYYDTSSDDYWY